MNEPMVLTAERLRHLLHYDSDSGEFTWKNGPNRRLRGMAAGAKSEQGYIRIMLDSRRYAAHRLAWLYVHGKWPERDIDHFNGDRADNRIANLRDVSRSVNASNRYVCSAKNSTGFIGVTKEGDVFRASIYVGRKRTVLGWFSTAQEAHAAYLLAKPAHHPDARGHGLGHIEQPQPLVRCANRMRTMAPQIVALRAAGLTQREISRRTGVGQPEVCKVLKRVRGNT